MKGLWKLALAALMVLLILLIPVCLLRSVFGGMSVEREIKRVESPDGRCWAVVIESDQGALGGATYVDVVEKPKKLLFFQLPGESRRVYTGGLSEAQSIRVTWQDGDTLLINGEAYPIKRSMSF